MREAGLIVFVAGIAASGYVAAQATIQPGQWETTSTVTDADMPGVPAIIIGMMKGRPKTFSHCITPEQAAKDPRSLIQTGKSCTIQSFSMTGGKLSSVTVCPQPKGVMTVTSTGTYTPTSYTAASRMVMTGERTMTLNATVTSKLIGACK